MVGPVMFVITEFDCIWHYCDIVTDSIIYFCPVWRSPQQQPNYCYTFYYFLSKLLVWKGPLIITSFCRNYETRKLSVGIFDLFDSLSSRGFSYTKLFEEQNLGKLWVVKGKQQEKTNYGLGIWGSENHRNLTPEPGRIKVFEVTRHFLILFRAKNMVLPSFCVLKPLLVIFDLLPSWPLALLLGCHMVHPTLVEGPYITFFNLKTPLTFDVKILYRKICQQQF